MVAKQRFFVAAAAAALATTAQEGYRLRRAFYRLSAANDAFILAKFSETKSDLQAKVSGSDLL